MNTTKYYIMIMNLRNAADSHKKDCNENCNVSLGLLKDTAKELLTRVSNEELLTAAQYLVDWPV